MVDCHFVELRHHLVNFVSYACILLLDELYVLVPQVVTLVIRYVLLLIILTFLVLLVMRRRHSLLAWLSEMFVAVVV